ASGGGQAGDQGPDPYDEPTHPEPGHERDDADPDGRPGEASLIECREDRVQVVAEAGTDPRGPDRGGAVRVLHERGVELLARAVPGDEHVCGDRAALRLVDGAKGLEPQRVAAEDEGGAGGAGLRRGARAGAAGRARRLGW